MCCCRVRSAFETFSVQTSLIYTLRRYDPDKDVAAIVRPAVRQVAGATKPPQLCARDLTGNRGRMCTTCDSRALQGSIKDMIYACPKEWKTSYIQKYTAKRGSPLPEKTVASFSRQILEGMMFLERKGWPYQVVSTGNVLLSRNQSHCQLCDVESAILGVAPRTAHMVRSAAAATSPHQTAPSTAF